jgi:hypothetical protein
MIKINIDMPDICCDCPCYCENYNRCEIKQEVVSFEELYENKPEWCPLIEVKNESSGQKLKKQVISNRNCGTCGSLMKEEKPECKDCLGIEGKPNYTFDKSMNYLFEEE